MKDSLSESIAGWRLPEVLMKIYGFICHVNFFNLSEKCSLFIVIYLHSFFKWTAIYA